jgi:RNA polymerase sigma factor (sigma-70 family)
MGTGPREPKSDGKPARWSEVEHATLPHLIARIQAGETTLIWELYRRYSEAVRTYLASIVAEPHTAEDLAHDVFCELARAIGTYRSERGEFEPWLFRIAHNAAVDYLRHQRRVDPVDPDDIRELRDVAPSGDSDTWPERLSDRAFLFLVKDLPPVQRQVLALRYLIGMRSVDIAQFLGRSPASVRQLHRRALRTLARQVASEQESALGLRASPAVTRRIEEAVTGPRLSVHRV